MQSESDATREQPGASLRVRRFALAVLLLVHVGWSIWGLAPGTLSVDGSVYHLMVDRFASAGDLLLQNGHPLSSPELVIPMTHRVEDGLAPQYPPLTAVLAAPFYVVAGFRGLFVLNLVSFFLVVFMLHRIAVLLFG
ncbi:MAG: hypothetical protein R3324_17085, partial [Halobacteriales archaeon]|nr:hypothetical protein [Halobacteriales archaeon]